MAEKDTVTKEYMQDAEKFADAFNFLLYDGEQIIKPEHLKPLDTAAIALPYGDDSKSVPIQKYRDVLKMATAMEDENATYLILGIENQSDIHYAMPVRNMLYDALQYSSQISEISKAHKKNRDATSGDEFLSGIHKEDRILPVVTLTIYFGAKEWDAPRSLAEMFVKHDERLMQFISDYKLNIIAPIEIPDEDFSKFHSELNLALKYIKYSRDKKKLRDMVNNDTTFKSVSRKTADMINFVTSSNLHYANGEERVDMCEAIEGIRNDAIAEGVMEGVLKTLIELVKDGILTISDAATRANMTVSEFEEKTGLKA